MKKLFLLLLGAIAISSCTRYSAEDQIYVDSLKQEKSFYSWQSAEHPYQLHYLEKGKGDRHIVLLHGFAANTFTWHNQIDLLASRGYHVWAFDFLGFGLSDKPLDIEYSLPLYRQQVLDFLDAKGIKQAHLVGHSMGGAVSLSVAAAAPDRIQSLILLDPAAYPLDLPFPLSLGKSFGKMILPFFSRSMIQNALTHIYYDASLITDEQVDAYWLPYTVEGGREAFVKVLKAFDNQILEEMSQSYPSLRMPTLLVWGQQDDWIPSSYLERLGKEIPHAQQAMINSCGHAPQEEQPERFNPILIEFLRLQ